MRASPDAYAIICHDEHLELEAYPDPGSKLGKACAALRLPMRQYRQVLAWATLDAYPWTIGYGRAHGVHQGDVCTPEQAMAWVHEDVGATERGVWGLVADLNPSQCQFDALVSLVFNIGVEAFATSMLLRLLRAGAVNAAADQILRWDHCHGVVMDGLTKRRAQERALFLTGVVVAAA